LWANCSPVFPNKIIITLHIIIIITIIIIIIIIIIILQHYIPGWILAFSTRLFHSFLSAPGHGSVWHDKPSADIPTKNYGAQVIPFTSASRIYGAQVIRFNSASRIYGAQVIQFTSASRIYGTQVIRFTSASRIYGAQVIRFTSSSRIVGFGFIIRTFGNATAFRFFKHHNVDMTFCANEMNPRAGTWTRLKLHASICTVKIRKGKAFPLLAWTGPWGSRRLRLQNF
jgi:hypothetical protein